MMMGQGSFVYGGGSSNLSALAPPFTVDRSVTKPLVDLNESTPYQNNWPNPRHPPNSRADQFSASNPEFDSSSYAIFHSSTAQLLPPNPHVSVSTDSVLYSHSPPSFHQAEPYYPSSYVSPAFGNDCPFGYDLLFNSHVATSAGSSHGDHAQSLSTQWSGMWDGITDWQQSKQVQLDGSFCSSYTNQGLRVSESASKYEEVHSADKVSRQTQTGSIGGGQFEYKSFNQFTATDFSTPLSMPSASLFPSFPQVPSSKAVDSWNQQAPCSASYEKCVRRHDSYASGDNATFMKSFPAVVIKPPSQGTGSSVNVNTGSNGDVNDLSCNNHSAVIEPRRLKTVKGSVRYDPSQVSLHLGKTGQVITDVASIENEIDSSDHFFGGTTINIPHTSLDGLVDKNEAINPAVDSPCWRGAPFSNFSQFDISGAATLEKLTNIEASGSSNPQGCLSFSLGSNDAVKTSLEQTTKELIQHDDGSEKRALVGCMLHAEGISNNVSGDSPAKPTLLHQVQIFDDAQSNKSLEYENKLPRNKQQSYEGEQTPESNFTPVVGVANVGINMNDNAGNCSSHVSFDAIECMLSTPTSADNASIKPTKACRAESTEKTHIRTLINKMQNLSELLVFDFSNDACELREDDSDALQDVINKLQLCILKKVERTTSVQESLVPNGDTSQLPRKSSPMLIPERDASQFLRKSSMLEKHVLEERNDASGENDENLSNHNSVRGTLDALKNDVTQAIKKALNEKFRGEEEEEPQVLLYRNLWLEAEASLCYASCTARFNQMKSEMEKHSSGNANGLPKNRVSSVSSGPQQGNVLAPNTESSLLPDTSIPETSSSSTSHDAADVAGFAEKLSNSQVPPCSSDTENVTHKEDNDGKHDKVIQDSPASNIISHEDDIDALAMARFHILRSRVDNLTSRDKSETWTADPGSTTPEWHAASYINQSEDKTLEMDMESHSPHCNRNAIEDKPIIKEFYSYGKASQAGCCEGSSDWEHVLLEELAGQNN